MKNQSDDSPKLVVLKLDNGELAEDVKHSDTAASGAEADERLRIAYEIVESNGLPAGLGDVDPAEMRPGFLPRHARHPSTDQRSHPARIEEDI